MSNLRYDRRSGKKQPYSRQRLHQIYTRNFSVGENTRDTFSSQSVTPRYGIWVESLLHGAVIARRGLYASVSGDSWRDNSDDSSLAWCVGVVAMSRSSMPDNDRPWANMSWLQCPYVYHNARNRKINVCCVWSLRAPRGVREILDCIVHVQFGRIIDWSMEFDLCCLWFARKVFESPVSLLSYSSVDFFFFPRVIRNDSDVDIRLVKKEGRKYFKKSQQLLRYK